MLVDKVENLRKKVISLAVKLALQESERTGEDYTKCISKSLDEACTRLNVERKQFIRMFV